MHEIEKVAIYMAAFSSIQDFSLLAAQRPALNHPLCGWRQTALQSHPSDRYRRLFRPSRIRVEGAVAMAQKAYSLSHTKWMCKHRIVFTPKYRRKATCSQIRSDIGEILRKLCGCKGSR